MLSKLKANSKGALLIHLILMGIVGFGLILLFFYIYLPMATDHGKTQPVPTVRGKSVSEAAAIFGAQGLRHEVIDSTYDSSLPPLSIVAQHPMAGEQVKSQRKIYLTTNYAEPPSLQLPKNLITQSLKNAQEQLTIIGLNVGEIRQIPYRFKVVTKVYFEGKELTQEDLSKGYLVKKGKTIDLVVGDGRGSSRSIKELNQENPEIYGGSSEDMN